MLIFNEIKVNKLSNLDQKRLKIRLGWAAFVFVVFHFTMIVLYAMPESLAPSSFNRVSKPYVEPIFTQRWSMFAPCPVIDGKVEVKYYFQNGSTDWISPTEDARKWHGRLRGTHHGELVLAESNLMYWLGLDLEHLGIQIGDDFPMDKIEVFYKGYSYYKIKDYLNGNAIYLYDQKPVQALMRCHLIDVKEGLEGTLELPVFSY